MVALVLKPLATELSSCMAPPGVLQAMSVSTGPPGVHMASRHSNANILCPPGLLTVLSAPPGLPAPPGLSGPPGLFAPPGLQGPPGLSDPRPTTKQLCDHVTEGEQAQRHLATENLINAPSRKLAPPGVFAPACPPGKFTPAGPPGFFFIAAPKDQDSDGLSCGDASTDIESDSERTLDGSFCD